jgi:putative oxidoreductase
VITLGLGTRLFAIALSILNVMAVISYYEALAKVGQVTPHIFWGACLMTNIVFGAGYFSIDHWLKTRNNPES